MWEYLVDLLSQVGIQVRDGVELIWVMVFIMVW